MKTLQEKYTGVREGKFSQFQWLKEAKLTLPHLISPYNGFEDAVQILKNRGMLHEEVKADLKKTDKSVEDTNAKSFSYGEMSAANVNFDQMLKGMQIEIEKDPELSEEKAREKAIKNLVQDPYFYLKNQAFGIEGIGYTEDVPGLKPSKTDQMEKVKLKEDIRRLIKGTLNESKAVSSRLKEIEAETQILALERKIEAISEEIEERNHKISAVDEMDMKDMINPAKVKELQKEIKLLEKEKSKMEKMMEKLSKKGKKKVVTAADKDEDMVPDDKDMVDENSNKDLTYDNFVQMVRDDMMDGAAPDEYPSDERVRKDAKYLYNQYLQGASVDDLYEMDKGIEAYGGPGGELDNPHYEAGYDAFLQGQSRDEGGDNEWWLKGWDMAQDNAEQSNYYKI